MVVFWHHPEVGQINEYAARQARRGPVHTTLLLMTLAQLDGLSMWTDAQGVVHVASSQQAPAGAKAMEGGSYSVVDGDGRPLIMPDGGARADDAAWWRERFAQARLAVQTSQALESAAASDIRAADHEVCATATAAAEVRVVIPRRRGGVAQVVEQRAESTSRACSRGSVSGALRGAVQTRRLEREQAERALQRLEQEALAGHVPLREWR